MEIISLLFNLSTVVIIFLHQHALWIIAAYYVLFFVHSMMTLTPIRRALAIPTMYVFVGLVATSVLVALQTSGDCHPAHGWACEVPPELTASLFLSTFNGVVLIVQLFAIPVLLAYFKSEKSS